MQESGERRYLSLLLLFVLTAAGGGCGKKGNPLPPAHGAPLPVRDARARQLGDVMVVRFDLAAADGTPAIRQAATLELIRVAYAPGLEVPQDPEAFRRRGVVVAEMQVDPTAVTRKVSLEDHKLEALLHRGVGWTLRYAVRVRDRKDRPSALVIAADLVPLETVPAPTALTAEPTADGVRLRWSEAGSAAARFNVYRSQPGLAWPEGPLNAEPLAATEYVDTSVERSGSYVYEVRVSLAPGLPYRESAPSNPTQAVAEDRFAPAPPEDLVAVQEGLAVRLFWKPGSERDLGGYRVYRQVDGASWMRIGNDPVEQPLMLDRDVQIGQVLGYRVTAVDRTVPPNESAPSAIVQLELQEEPPELGGVGRE